MTHFFSWLMLLVARNLVVVGFILPYRSLIKKMVFVSPDIRTIITKPE